MNKTKRIPLRAFWTQENNYIDRSSIVVQHAIDILMEQMDFAILDSEIREAKAAYAVQNVFCLAFSAVNCAVVCQDSMECGDNWEPEPIPTPAPFDMPVSEKQLRERQILQSLETNSWSNEMPEITTGRISKISKHSYKSIERNSPQPRNSPLRQS